MGHAIFLLLSFSSTWLSRTIPLPVCVYLWLLWKRRAWLWLVWLTLSLTGLASFSYLRNWYVTGSALYPARFDVPGLRARFGSLDPFHHPYGELCRGFSELTDVFGAIWFLVAAGALLFCALRIRRGPRPVESLLLPFRHCRSLPSTGSCRIATAGFCCFRF